MLIGRAILRVLAKLSIGSVLPTIPKRQINAIPLVCLFVAQINVFRTLAEMQAIQLQTDIVVGGRVLTLVAQSARINAFLECERGNVNWYLHEAISSVALFIPRWILFWPNAQKPNFGFHFQALYVFDGFVHRHCEVLQFWNSIGFEANPNVIVIPIAERWKSPNEFRPLVVRHQAVHIFAFGEPRSIACNDGGGYLLSPIIQVVDFQSVRG